MKQNQVPDSRDLEQEEPPPFGRWSQWYAVVLGFLVLLIALFTWFSRSA